MVASAPSPGGERCASRKGLAGRPRFDIGDIFRAHVDEYLRRCRPTAAQLRVMDAIIDCRTEALGGHACVCAKCGHHDIAYNSCRNRHCPKCQTLAQARWLEAREARILPVPYYHVVFTLPSELRVVAMRHPRVLYGMLFKAASATLLELGRDPKRLGGTLGITAVLHTWRRDLRYHPHLHCVVTGGALSEDGERWLPSPDGFLFPVQVMSKLFRGKFMAAFEKAWQSGDVRLEDDDPLTFARLRGRLFLKSWVVYSKRPFAGPEQVFAYLGRYTHRVGISNHRIDDVTPTEVRIKTRDGKTDTMPPYEFMRRFLLHVLPHGFTKIRHYGLMASACIHTKHAAAARLLGEPRPRPEAPPESWFVLLARLLGHEPTVCPACGERAMFRDAPHLTLATARGPPAEPRAA